MTLESDGALSWPLPSLLPLDEAGLLLSELTTGWTKQLHNLNRHGGPLAPLRAEGPEEMVDLVADLGLLRTWFDPTASGGRLRKEIGSLEPWQPTGLSGSNLVFQVSDEAWLVTPEGRAAIWCLRRALADRSDTNNQAVWLQPTDLNSATEALLAQYRDWTRQRLQGVTSLLMGETSTLRPTAAGLLLVLLINRNTAPERAIPKPKSTELRQAISASLATPALAYAHVLSGRTKAAEKGLSLFGGWALGELSRRLGGGLETDGRVYIRQEAVARAEDRLMTDMRQRPAAIKARVPEALHACQAAYEQSRPVLNSLGLAFERPADTASLVERLRHAAATG